MEPAPACALTSAPGRTPDARRRLLVVDDNPSVRAVVRRLAEVWGYTCGEAPDGLAALRCLQCQPIALVLTDHDMPRLDGIALLRSLAASARQEGRAMLPAILMTGDLSEDVRTRALQAGARAVLRKPLDAAALRSTVHALLDPAHP